MSKKDLLIQSVQNLPLPWKLELFLKKNLPAKSQINFTKSNKIWGQNNKPFKSDLKKTKGIVKPPLPAGIELKRMSFF